MFTELSSLMLENCCLGWFCYDGVNLDFKLLPLKNNKRVGREHLSITSHFNALLTLEQSEPI